MKSSVWDICTVENVLHKRVCFDEPLTKEEAIDRFLSEEYEDVLDFEFMGVIEVTDAEPIGDDEGDEDTSE